MSHKYKTVGKRQQWVGILGLLAVLLFASAVPGHAWRGGHGFGGRGFHSFHRFHRFGGPHIGIGIGIGPFWGPYWASYTYPYAYPYVYPPVVVQPAPPVSTPLPPRYWYYCNNPQGYYPYVQHCPGGWRPVAPSPQ
jgi:hypothetical protein